MVNTPTSSIAVSADLGLSSRQFLLVGAALVIGLCWFVVAFLPEIETAIAVWNSHSAYNHCFLVLPVAVYLAWDRQQAVRATRLCPSPWIALLAIPAAAAWFVADRLGIMEGRQLAAMALLQIMFVSLLGPQTGRALAVPLLYLFFLVPFGEFFVTPLQQLVVHFTTNGLNLLGIPNFSDGITIETPEGPWLVHQACSGLRFLVATAAFGVLFACVMFRSPLRRILFIALSLVVAIVGNCFRVLGIIVIAHFIGNAEAAEANHVLWGWLFYVIIGFVLIAFGLRFRQDRQPPARLANPSSYGSATATVTFITLAAALFIGSIPLAAARYLDNFGTATELKRQIEAPVISGCDLTAMPAGLPAPWLQDDAESALSNAYQCGPDFFVLTVKRYSPRIAPRQLFTSIRQTINPDNWDIIRQTGDFRVGTGTDAAVWRVSEGANNRGYAAVAMALWLDGRPAGAGISARVSQAINSVRPSATAPAVAIITYFGGHTPKDAQDAINAILAKASPALSAIVHALN